MVMAAQNRFWKALKVWRQIRLGPASIVFRFRRSGRISRNRGIFANVLSNRRASDKELAMTAPPGSVLTVSGHLDSSPADQPQRDLAIVFGVGPGLGHSLARKLLASGAHVALISRRLENLSPLARELVEEGYGDNLKMYFCDASDERGVQSVFGLVHKDFGVPSLVVFSMQKSIPGKAIDMEVDAFEDCWRTNCLAGFIVGREAARCMQSLHRGSIVFVGSTSGLIGREDHLNLAIGKFGLRALSQVMARELWKEGLHVSHVVIDADIREPNVEFSAAQSDPDAIAEVILSIHKQPRSAWASEVDVRPWNEEFWKHC
jgi:NAD(P)-dependent dehydrogenase (short-subunit alcohol dehydrogenase family)